MPILTTIPGIAALAISAVHAPADHPPAPTRIALAQVSDERNSETRQGDDLGQQIAAERAELERQQAVLDAQRKRLDALERRMSGQAEPAMASGAVPLPASPPPAPPAPPRAQSAQATQPAQPAVPTVGQAPREQREVPVAVLADQGGIITRRNRLTVEADLEYARADRNRVVFRGIEIPASVLIGVFDINESRQDVLTAAVVARYGVTNRLEINGRAPYIYRSDKSVLAPVADPNNPNAGQINNGVANGGLGDVDFGMRYQFTKGGGRWPYLIAGVQAIAPTGSDPFTVRRDALGNALEAANGAGFWAISPSLTAIMPSDPAVLFGTLGYTYNFARDINTSIGANYVERVAPGGQPSGSAGIAISLNPRTSISFGYAHSWVFGTKTRLRTVSPRTGQLGDAVDIKTRDLQLGRLLLGVSYRAAPRTTINWNVEVGATDDATDLRTTLRIPFTFGG